MALQRTCPTVSLRAGASKPQFGRVLSLNFGIIGINDINPTAASGFSGYTVPWSAHPPS